MNGALKARPVDDKNFLRLRDVGFMGARLGATGSGGKSKRVGNGRFQVSEASWCLEGSTGGPTGDFLGERRNCRNHLVIRPRIGHFGLSLGEVTARWENGLGIPNTGNA